MRKFEYEVRMPVGEKQLRPLSGEIAPEQAYEKLLAVATVIASQLRIAELTPEEP